MCYTVCVCVCVCVRVCVCAHPLKLSLPVLLSLDHGLDSVRERGDNSGRGRLESERLSSEVNTTRVDWRMKQGPFEVWVISGGSQRDWFGKGEGIAARSSMAAAELGVLDGAVCQW